LGSGRAKGPKFSLQPKVDSEEVDDGIAADDKQTAYAARQENNGVLEKESLVSRDDPALENCTRLHEGKGIALFCESCAVWM